MTNVVCSELEDRSRWAISTHQLFAAISPERRTSDLLGKRKRTALNRRFPGEEPD